MNSITTNNNYSLLDSTTMRLLDETELNLTAERVAIQDHQQGPGAADLGENSAGVGMFNDGDDEGGDGSMTRDKLTKLFVFTALGIVGAIVALALSAFYGVKLCVTKVQADRDRRHHQQHPQPKKEPARTVTFNLLRLSDDEDGDRDNNEPVT